MIHRANTHAQFNTSPAPVFKARDLLGTQTPGVMAASTTEASKLLRGTPSNRRLNFTRSVAWLSFASTHTNTLSSCMALTLYTNSYCTICRPSINAAESETETSLSSTASLGAGSLYGRRTGSVGELQDLLEALDTARETVKAQLDAHDVVVARRRW